MGFLHLKLSEFNLFFPWQISYVHCLFKLVAEHLTFLPFCFRFQPGFFLILILLYHDHLHIFLAIEFLILNLIFLNCAIL
jgi:hypothetical protein